MARAKRTELVVADTLSTTINVEALDSDGDKLTKKRIKSGREAETGHLADW